MRKTLGILMMATLFTLVSLSAFAQRTGPAQIEFSGVTQSKITFSHQTHEARVPDCKNCHHMGVGTGTCKDCHGKDARFPDAKTALHTSCRGCHEKMNVSAQGNCSFCHADSGTTTTTRRRR